MSGKKKLKTFLCIEHGEKFVIDAVDIEEAREFAAMYGGEVIEEYKGE